MSLLRLGKHISYVLLGVNDTILLLDSNLEFRIIFNIAKVQCVENLFQIKKLCSYKMEP